MKIITKEFGTVKMRTLSNASDLYRGKGVFYNLENLQKNGKEVYLKLNGDILFLQDENFDNIETIPFYGIIV